MLEKLAGPLHEKVTPDAVDNKSSVLPEQTAPPVDALTDGAEFTVNSEPFVPVPLGVVTFTVPVVPDPIVATITVPVFETMDAAVPPIVTEVAPVKKFPLIVMLLPTHPLAAPKPEIVGAGRV